MTIRILQAWNGYPQQAVVSMSSSEENRLVGLGIASFDLDGPAENLRMAQLATDAGGGLKISGADILSIRPQKFLAKDVVTPVKKFGRIESSSAAGYTWHETIDLPFGVDAIQVRVWNAIASTVANYKAAIAFSDAAVDGNANSTTPSGAWTNITFSGASTVTVPAATSASGSDIIPGYVDSDIMYVPSIAKASGNGTFAMLRGYWPTGNGTRTSISQPPTLASSGFMQAFQAGDLIATPSGFTSTTASSNGPSIELICYTRAQVKKVAGFGDSITQGLDDTENMLGWLYRATNGLSTSAVPVVQVNYGWASQTSRAYLTNAINAMAQDKIHVATFFPFSPNDTDKYTAAGEQRQIYNTSAFIDAATKNGVVPILCTPVPVAGLTAPQETSRRKIAQAIRDMAGYCRVADFDLLLNDYTVSTGGWAVAGDTSGTVHPSAQGHGKMATLISPIISSALDLT